MLTTVDSDDICIIRRSIFCCKCFGAFAKQVRYHLSHVAIVDTVYKGIINLGAFGDWPYNGSHVSQEEQYHIGICSMKYSGVSNTRPVLNKSPGAKIGQKQ